MHVNFVLLILLQLKLQNTYSEPLIALLPAVSNPTAGPAHLKGFLPQISSDIEHQIVHANDWHQLGRPSASGDFSCWLHRLLILSALPVSMVDRQSFARIDYVLPQNWWPRLILPVAFQAYLLPCALHHISCTPLAAGILPKLSQQQVGAYACQHSWIAPNHIISMRASGCLVSRATCPQSCVIGSDQCQRAGHH